MSAPELSLPTSIQQLVDMETIRQTFYHFAQALDDRNWTAMRAFFAEWVDADYTAWGIPRQQMAAESVIALFQASFWRPELRTQHLYTNFRIQVEGDSATTVFNFLGQHTVPGFADGEEFFLRGQYTDSLQREGDGWKISSLALRVFSTQGAAAILAPAT